MRRSTTRSLLTATAMVLLLAACGSGDAEGPAPLAIVANGPGTLTTDGPERLLVGLLGEDTESLAAPDRPAEIDLYFGTPDNIVATVPATYVPTVPGVRGLYRISVSFGDPGLYGVIVRAEGLAPSQSAPFAVTEESLVPEPGDPAPPSQTATIDTNPIEEISSDPNPDPSFYDLSVAEAVTNGRPTVIVFSTPAWCQTATCGPTLDIAKEVAPQRPDIDFVHVEVYENLDATRFEDLVVVPAVVEWNLPSEPWVFVVDANGVIVADFEGALTPDELAAALP